MEDLLEEFVAETREMLDSLEGEVVAWEADPADRERLDSIFRFVHTVKGNCGFLDLPRLEKLSHATESTLAEVRAGRRQADSTLASTVLAVIDRIAEIVIAIENDGSAPQGDDQDLIDALDENGEGYQETDSGKSGGSAAFANRNSGPVRSIRLPVNLLDRMMSEVSDLVLVRNELARQLGELPLEAGAKGTLDRFSTILDSVRDGMTRIRMQRLDTVFNTLPRLVRDLSAELGKQVLVDIEGEDVELDREMIEFIRDPLIHIIRNALDHGIETPAERRAAGKHEIGMLSISARQTGNRVLIQITDDGRGIDCDKVVAKALAAGIIDAETARNLSPAKKMDLIFSPGLSTAEEVSPVSGRGVGMDVVRANIERLGGNVITVSNSGEGTRILLRLPLTLSIVPALTFGLADQRFAMPQAYVEEVLDGGAEGLDFSQVGDQQYVTVRAKRIRCISLSEVLGISGARQPQDGLLIIIQLISGDTAALAVDRVWGQADLVIKPLPPVLAGCQMYSGTTSLDDGAPMMMLEVSYIAFKAGVIADLQDGRAKSAADEAETMTPDAAEPVFDIIRFQGLDGRWRAIRMDAVDRIDRVWPDAIDLSAMPPRVTIDDEILPLAGIEPGQMPHEAINMLRLSDGQRQLAYATGGLADTGAIATADVVALRDGKNEGVTLIDGSSVELLDCHRLFAEFARPAAPAVMPVCRLRLDDRWMRSVLRPLVESAGYAVIGEDDGKQADIAFVYASDTDTDIRAERIVRIASDDGPAGDAGVVAMYDRNRLLAALHEERKGEAA